MLRHWHVLGDAPSLSFGTESAFQWLIEGVNRPIPRGQTRSALSRTILSWRTLKCQPGEVDR
jgi:hypothetical protein